MPILYRLTQDAQRDLIEIRQFTMKQWGTAQSQKYLLELRKTIRLLADTPFLGKFKSDIGTDILSFPYASHVIYYVVHKWQLVVFGVLHKRMVPLNHLAEREVI
ncbi:type II toxin-antitoxin system RelE/ParE family toxin [Photorhabdus sp. CRCIA-P01]|uniref:type II toxin-antitoxin system RelE/ParE family toxin n=1 Tax=Photorhabdus sp. CRCIA-P01 TaxID=2019570 RepID=UPI000E599D3B|nr:type II toxin-antitoxin system RelE/ParE family toxin [Photorhabdus sp. CRCIA-P01]